VDHLGPWRLWAGHYDWNRSWPDTIMDSVRIEKLGGYLRFAPPVTDTYEIGWKGWPGSAGQFLIYDVLPAGR
jgi:hypothetical protein